MEIKIRKTWIVIPKKKTRRRSIPFTVVDQMFSVPRYNSVVHVYRPSESAAVDTVALRESLSKTLVHFYLMAGRFTLDGNRIDCNDAGVPFSEAEISSDLEALGDFAPSPVLAILLPPIDYTQDISSYPFLAVQVTYFKCGGVCVSIRVQHRIVDGSSFFHLIKSWSEIAHGRNISLPPFLDRTSVLRPRNPPRPKFDHPEYPRTHDSAIKISDSLIKTKVSIFRLNKDQLNEMKATVPEKSTFALLAGHIWKCVTTAREVSGDEEMTLFYSVNARSDRLSPKLPPGFFGNAIFRAMPIARAGDLVSKPSSYAASKIQEALLRMDDEYIRSEIDHISLLPDLSTAREGPHLYNSRSFQITSWARMGLEDADFGWGPPVYSGPGEVKFEKAYIFSGGNDGGLSVTIALQAKNMDVFEKLFHDFGGNKKHLFLSNL